MSDADTARAPRRAPRADQPDATGDEVIAPGADAATAETGAEDPAPTGDGAGPGPVTETPAPAEAEAGAEQNSAEVVVDEWFAGFNNTALSRNEEFWSLVRDRLPELKAAIGALAPPAQS